MTIHWLKKGASAIANASANKLKLFADIDNLFKTKDEQGIVRVLGDGIANIELISTNGLEKTYRITRQSGVAFDYIVSDGTDGANGTGTPANAPPPAVAATSSVGTTTAEYALEDHTHAGVTSFNGRQGAVTPQQADYDAFFTTPAEAAAAAPVQSFNGRTGSITPQQSDYDAFFTTPAEASAAAPVQSVNGQTGAVVVQSGANAVTNSARSASFSTAVTTVGTFPITGGSIAAGAQYRIKAVLLVTNTTATSNLVATVAVGATAVATLTQALGATARTAQTVIVEGSITFSSAAAADGHVRAFTSAAVVFDTATGTGATQAVVATATNTDVNLKLNTSAATSTIIVKELTIEKVK